MDSHYLIGYEPEVFGYLDIKIRIFSMVIVDAFWP
jgi:hypothetical protein